MMSTKRQPDVDKKEEIVVIRINAVDCRDILGKSAILVSTRDEPDVVSGYTCYLYCSDKYSDTLYRRVFMGDNSLWHSEDWDNRINKIFAKSTVVGVSNKDNEYYIALGNIEHIKPTDVKSFEYLVRYIDVVEV